MSVISVDFTPASATADRRDVPNSCPFAEVLTCDTGTGLGYRLGGHFAGPDVLIVGHAPIADQVFDRLITLPTLGWLRGTLTLINLSVLTLSGENPRLAQFFQPRPDELLFLPYHITPETAQEAATQGYWSVLRLCADMGMIAGRGVPRPTAARQG